MSRNRPGDSGDLVIEASARFKTDQKATKKGGEEMKRLLFATITMALISGTAYAMPGHGMPGMGGPGAHAGQGLLRALLNLDLSEAQKHEAALILSKYKEEGQELRTTLRSAVEVLRRTSETEPFNEEAVRSAFKGVADAGEEMAVHGARLAAELRGILTPEQQEALEEHKAARLGKRKGRMENRISFLDEWIETHSKEPR
jgi:Spy/CpxP family protein refolding chaperone